MVLPLVSYVVIGRNEEAHLEAALRSVFAQAYAGEREVLYVDSRSTDRSVEIARSFPGVRVLVLDDPAPSAAKARNLGWRAARGALVHFVDGDAELVPEWTTIAVAAFAHPEVAAVFGWFRERHPERSVYNRWADLDWPMESGPAQAFGGIVLVRRECLAETGGFDERLLGAEEPVLTMELLRRGRKVLQLPHLMAWHDIGLLRFADYWRRCVLTGWHYAERADRFRVVFGRSEGWSQNLRTLVLAAFTLLVLLLALVWSPWILAVAAVLGAADLLRLARNIRARAGGFGHALLYALHLRFLALPMTVGYLSWRFGPRTRT